MAKHQESETTLLTINPDLLNVLAEKKVIYFFRDTARTVPAYSDFLNTAGVDADSINTFRDFESLVP